MPRRRLRFGLQLAGFAIGLALLAWAVSIALKEENREQLQHLADASAGQIAMLLGLSAVSLLINGVSFWAIITPTRPLRCLDVVAVNNLATFLAYLPFKLSVITRAAIHNRRDGVPLLTIGAWLMAIAAAMGAGLGPPLLASVIRPAIDVAWIAIAGVGVIAAGITLVMLGRYFGYERGVARLHRILDPITPKRWRHLLRHSRFLELHEGFAMLASPRAVTIAVGLRVTDLLVQAARFVVAAKVLGMDLGFTQAVLLALSYFILGVVSPSGMLGVREMGTTFIASIAAMAASDQFVGVALLVTSAESIVTLAGAGLGLAWLRPDRLFTRRTDASASGGD